jgi:hypothetical protein
LHIKTSEIIALGALAATCVNGMRGKQKWLTWIFGVTCVGALLVALFSSNEEKPNDNHSTNAVTTVSVGGDNNGNVALMKDSPGSSITQVITNQEALPRILDRKFNSINIPVNSGFKTQVEIKIGNFKDGDVLHYALPQGFHFQQEPTVASHTGVSLDVDPNTPFTGPVDYLTVDFITDNKIQQKDLTLSVSHH